MMFFFKLVITRASHSQLAIAKQYNFIVCAVVFHKPELFSYPKFVFW